MSAWDGYLIPIPELFQQTLSSSLTAGLDRWSSYQLDDSFTAALTLDLHGVLTHSGSTPRVAHSSSGFVMPTYADDLFGHWLLVPARLDMGNLLTNQARNVEIANMFLTPQSISTVVNSGGLGISLSGVPTLPKSVNSFDSIIIAVSVSTDGPPTINGTIDFTFSGSAPISLPLSGTRITMFPWQPDVPVNETLEWATDVMTSANDTEQRASILLAPRQRIRMSVMFDDALQWQKMHNVVFDWMPRVWGLPIWWEQRPVSAAVASGSTFLPVDTSHADFRVGGLVMIMSTSDGTFEAFQIDSFTSTQINLTSLVENDYTASATVMPVRSAYLSATPSGSRKLNNAEALSVEFLTLDNIDLGDSSGASTLNGLVLLDDPNASGTSLAETWSRDITVIDGKTGRVFQTTLIDRSRMHTKKGWELNNLADTWRIRKLLHSFRGNLNTFYLPTFRADFTLVQDIVGGSTSFRTLNNGYTQFAQSRAPMNYVRLLFNDGTYLIRQITGSSEDGLQEVVTIVSAFSGSTILVASVKRLEIVVLMRIQDDKATFQHSSAGVADVDINVISTKG